LILQGSLRVSRSEQNPDDRVESHGAKAPAHPEEIPFSSIRCVRREGAIAPSSHRLLLVHALSDRTLEIEQTMMWPSDFDELETVLRAAIAAEFATAPPPPPSP
jgi:hypothetical protein